MELILRFVGDGGKADERVDRPLPIGRPVLRLRHGGRQGVGGLGERSETGLPLQSVGGEIFPRFISSSNVQFIKPVNNQ